MSNNASRQGPVMLIVMDGWGMHPDGEHNAIKLGNTPNFDRFMKEYPSTQLSTSGTDVGLPKGTMGNSEVGHLNIGGGRVVWQDLMRINNAIAELSFFENPALLGAIEHAKKNNSRLHLFGLISGAVVHSCEEHYFALIRMAKQHGLTKDRVIVHMFTDGRDTPPRSGEIWVADFQRKLDYYDTGVVGSVIGRYYAMDRDKRWDRVERAYNALVNGESEFTARSSTEAVAAAYARADKHTDDVGYPAEVDEFIRPTLIVGDDGKPQGLIKDGDAVISFNHRSDRPREIIRTLIEDNFEETSKDDPTPGFKRRNQPKVHLVTMTDYRAGFDAPIAFDSKALTGTLGEVASRNGLKQFHCAETEKYAHVTFFFNGGREEPFELEERYMAKSPSVATYDMQPEMSAAAVTEKVLEVIRAKKYDLLIINYANGDMVGHTGIKDAAVKAVAAVDEGVGALVEAMLKVNGEVIVTSDHGNCEEMWDPKTNGPHTAHTTNPVPCYLISERHKSAKLREGGRMADLSPTICHLLGIEKSEEMEGESLLAD